MNNINDEEINEQSIAIIGLSGRFPGAKNVDEFWQNLKNGVESIRFFSDQELIESGIDPVILKDTRYVKAKGALDNVADFDAAFFDMSPKEAEITDPQQRLFLECAWEALENAGYDPKTYAGSIGVYGGIGNLNTYLLENLYSNNELRKTIGDFQIGINNSNDFVCTRVSYKLNLSGPSVTVQTACSTSLVAVVMGYQSLLDYQCDIALVGGAGISPAQKNGYFAEEGGILSPDGHCRAFDAQAKGTVEGNGVGIVVLKRLADALNDGDMIHAVIKGAALNNDGALKVGFTAPSLEAQTRVIKEALMLAEISPETIGYIETHGTGTPLGDPIEIAALTKAFRAYTNKKGYCAISCAKTNIGHLDSASGIAGLIKAVLSLKHRLIPPLLHFETPNPKLDLANSPFYINTELSEWTLKGTPRRVGVSSFGMGGTNAHVILEEAPQPKAETQKSSRPWQLLLLSARTSTALEQATVRLKEHLKQHSELDLADVAYTYQVGRCAFKHRRMLVCQTLEDAIDALETPDTKRVLTQTIKSDKKPALVFMFSGQGAQYVNMGLELYQTESVFRKYIDHCSEFLKPHLGLDLRTVLYPALKIPPTPPLSKGGNSEEISSKPPLQNGGVPPFEKGGLGGIFDLNQTAITQPALFVIEYALAQLWINWGIKPKAMIGHSIGEYVAACLAGIFTLEEALILVAARGRLIQSVSSGAMLAIPMTEAEIRPLLNQHLDLAAINAPFQSVVSGTFEAIEQLATQLAKQGVECQRLHTSHAFHSKMMTPILPDFLQQVQTIQLKSPQIPFISNVTGTWISDSEATDPNYWVKHLSQTVRFADGLQEIFKGTSQIWLEIGPGRTLSTFTKQHPSNNGQLVLTSLRHPKEEHSDSAFVLNTLGQLWINGITINWSEFYANEQRYRLPLPTYPFERQHYWIDAQKSAPEVRQTQQQNTTSQPLWPSLIDSVQKQAQQGVAEFDNPVYIEKYQWLKRLAAAYVNLALRELGAFSDSEQQYAPDELLSQFHILPFYRQMLSRCLVALVELKHLRQSGEKFRHLIPFSKDDLNTLIEEVQTRWIQSPELPKLVQLCGERFAAILTGKENPKELLFSGSAYDTLQHYYKSSPESHYLNMIVPAGIKQIVKYLSPNTPLRILEIGAGTGATTAYLLPELPPQNTHYVFTDIGASFLNQARQKFSEYPYLEYRLLDIEQNPAVQGYKTHSFDIVIAIQVLHATKNLGQTLAHVRSLLAPEGLLILGEAAVSSSLWFDVYLPIMQPFEESDELRTVHPFLTTEQWYDALRKYGFVEVDSFPKIDALDDRIFLAKASTEATLSSSLAFTAKVEPKTVLQKRANIADWFYIPSWKRFSLPVIASESSLSEQQCWLVFVDECGVGTQVMQQLELMGKSVISVKTGSAFLSENNQTYTLNPQHRDDYEALLKALHSQKKVPTTIVHLWSVTAHDKAESDLEQLETYQNLGFYSLLFLVQALGKQKITTAIQIDIVSNNLQQVTKNETVLCPEKATLIGACRVIPQEYSNINCRSIDIELSQSEPLPNEMLVNQLLAEFRTNSQTHDTIIAYRNNERWVQTFKQIRLNEKPSLPPRLREKGVYLITGGLGGIGLVLAEYLVKTVHAKLILLTHSAFPDKSRWDDWLIIHDEPDNVSNKIRKLQSLETMGADILIARADVANYEQMSAVIAQSLEQFGKINGVIHAAGVYPKGMIQLKTPAMIETLLAPKVKGTLVLEAVLKEQNLDFMVLCSSLASLFSETGMADHAAANAFLDAFAHRHSSQHDTFTVTINWDTWQEVGQAAQQQTHQEIYPLQDKEITHPLFDRCIIEGPDKTIYLSHLSATKHWVLGEHKVMGKYTLPGTAYLEMIVAAFENDTQNSGPLEIKNLYFLAPLIVESHEERLVRTILQKQDNEIEFIISSRSKLGTWQEHVKGQISYTGVELATKIDLRSIEEKCPQLGNSKVQKGIEVGARWNNLTQVKLGHKQGFAVLELPTEFSADVKNYKLHPALLDVATSFNDLGEDNTYLPFSYERLRIAKSLPTKFYSHIVVDKDNSSYDNSLTLDIQIIDEQGEQILEIENYTLRKAAAKDEKHLPIADCENFYLEIASPGILDSLTLKPSSRQKPRRDKVEIEVSVVGLNFKEVLYALNLLPSDEPIKFGLECAGKIVALGENVDNFNIGDEVIGIADAACFSAYKTIASTHIVPKPEHLSLEEAVTIPSAFMTAYHALSYLARLREGERVLIHSAAGGVGLAAVQIAQMQGAEIFATAGSPEKRAFLHSLGIKYVMDSRTLDFADEVMKYTDGQGVDVVLNSLGGGEYISTNFSLLAHAGRFLELGKRDIYENASLNLFPFRKGLSFFAIDVDHDTPYFADLFKEVIQHFRDGKLRPLPYQVFPITKVSDAFNYMARAKHIGKIVVSLQDKEVLFKNWPNKISLTDRSSKNHQFATSTVQNETHSTEVKWFQENLKEGLLPTEGIEVFKRILGNTQPQIVVSTRDLYGRLEKDVVQSFLQESGSTSLSKSAHSRPQLRSDYVAPRHEIEQTIANSWEKFLGIERIGIYDDFFELGGDSLMAVQLIAELRKKLQTELSTHSFLAKPTIASLAESIQLNSKKEAQSQILPHSLVTLQVGNSSHKQPIFLCHPIGGHIYIYRDLVRCLGTEQPVYGFQAPGIEGETQPFTQVEKMATHYLNALRVIQPQGPYILGGHSFGGMVALEIAQQLRSLGQKITLLFMMDSAGPETLLETEDFEDVKVMAYALGLNVNIDLPEDFRQYSLEEQICYYLKSSEITNDAYPEEFISHIRHFLDVIKANNRAMESYVPKNYPGKILFFRACERDEFLPQNPERSWGNLATEGMDIYEISGNHTSMNFSPNVEKIVNILETYLDK